MHPSNPGDDGVPAPVNQTGNTVNVSAWGGLDSTQIAGRDITNIRKRNIRVGLASLAVLAVVGGGSVVVVERFDDDAPGVFEEGMTEEDVAGVGSAEGEQGATQTALIYLQAAVAGDAATACGLVGADARAKRFALRGCEAVVTNYAESLRRTTSEVDRAQRLVGLIGNAQTTVRMRGTATAEIVVRPQGYEPNVVITAREDGRWRVIGTTIRGLGLD
jgi:hypothetical protein